VKISLSTHHRDDIVLTEYPPPQGACVSQMRPLPQARHHHCRRIKAVCALEKGCRARPLPFLPCPTTTTALFRHLPHTALSGTDRATRTSYSRLQPNHSAASPRLVPGLKQWNSGIVVRMVYKAQPDPVIRTSSPAPLAQDFARQQVSKQQRSNYHSSSLSSSVPRIMVSQSVNKTGLHPAGVQ
jgi:hypothetical protein